MMMSRNRYQHLLLVLHVLLLQPQVSQSVGSSRGRVRRTLGDVVETDSNIDFGLNGLSLDDLEANFKPNSDFSVSDAAGIDTEEVEDSVDADTEGAAEEGGEHHQAGPHASLHNEDSQGRHGYHSNPDVPSIAPVYSAKSLPTTESPHEVTSRAPHPSSSEDGKGGKGGKGKKGGKGGKGGKKGTSKSSKTSKSQKGKGGKKGSTGKPTPYPTPYYLPTAEPVMVPTTPAPTAEPSLVPTSIPTNGPSDFGVPTEEPVFEPTDLPTPCTGRDCERPTRPVRKR